MRILKIIKSKIGETKKGRRIWIEGHRLSDAGFSGGNHFFISDQGNRLVLNLASDGERKVSQRRGKPIIDMIGHWVSEKFDGFSRVKIIIRENMISICPDPIEVQIKESKDMICRCLRKGKPIPFVDIFTGGATSSKAIEHGSSNQLKSGMHIEANGFYSDLADQNLPDSISYQSLIQNVDMEDIPTVPLVAGYWPCDCFSTQGRAKKGLAGKPESGDTGYLYHFLLEILRASRCSTFVGECVPSFRNSVAATVTRKVLMDLGFQYQDEAVLRAQDFGDLTKRERFIFVASRLGPVKLPRGIPYKKRRLSDILERGPQKWLSPENSNTIKYLVEVHSKKHEAKGNGFGLLGATHLETDEYMPTISRTYSKIQPSALLRRGPDINEWRLFTPTEVARAHGIPEDHIKLPEAAGRQYEVLGQGTCFGMFSTIGKYLVDHMIQYATEEGEMPHQLALA